MSLCSTDWPLVTEVRGGFVEHLSVTKVAQQSVTKIISPTIMNLVTPKAGAKNELLFNKPASDSLYCHVQTKHSRFCENCQNWYRDDTRQTKNRQNRIVMIPSRYWNRIGGDT